MRGLSLVLVGAFGCQGPGKDDPPETGVGDTGSGPPTFLESLDPDQVRVLAGSLAEDDSLEDVLELTPDLGQVLWSANLEAGGAVGATRLGDGSTVYGRSELPPDPASHVERMDANGDVMWSYNQVFQDPVEGYVHDLAPTPFGDYVAVESGSMRVVSFDDGGQVLWELVTTGSGDARIPNAVALRPDGDGALMALTSLAPSGTDRDDQVSLYRLPDRTSPPQWVASASLMTEDGAQTWPVGPRFQEDGTLMVCLAALGRVLFLDGDLEEVARIPGPRARARLAFPWDAAFLPDGSLLVVDSVAEVLRVFDPLDTFQVVAAYPLPGATSVEPLLCAEGTCL